MHIPLDDVMRRWAASTNPWFAAYAMWAPVCNAWYTYNQMVLAAVYGPMLGAMLNANRGYDPNPHQPK